MDAASPQLLTVAVADESAIRHTFWHPQWAEAAISIARLIVVVVGTLEEILWSLFNIVHSTVSERAT